MFACISGLLLVILVTVTPAEEPPDSVIIVTKDRHGILRPYVRLKIDGTPITTDDKAEATIPFHGKRITIRIDPSQPESKRWLMETYEIPKQKVTLTIKEAHLKHPAAPTVGKTEPPYSDCYGYWIPQRVETRVPCVVYCKDEDGNCRAVKQTCIQSKSEYIWIPFSSVSGNCYMCKSERYISEPCDCTPCNLGEAKLTVSVPADAQVFINNRPTKSTGLRRVYLSKGLVDGVNYWYWVRVRVVRNGKVIEKVREVVLCAGDSKSISVDFSDKNSRH